MKSRVSMCSLIKITTGSNNYIGFLGLIGNSRSATDSP